MRLYAAHVYTRLPHTAHKACLTELVHAAWSTYEHITMHYGLATYLCELLH